MAPSYGIGRPPWAGTGGGGGIGAGQPPAFPQFGRGRPQQILGQADQAGFFGPYLPESFFSPIRNELISSGQAREHLAETEAALDAHGDPILGAFLKMQARERSKSDLARGISAARSQAMLQQLKFLQELFGQFSGAQFGAQATQQVQG